MAQATKNWSIYQLAIFRDVAEGEGHVLVQARAGTGKTTTIIEALRHLPSGNQALLIAFNKKIATELEQRAPQGVKVSTLHAFGFAALRNAFRTRMDADKAKRIAYRLFGDMPGARLTSMCKLIARAKGALMSDASDLDALADELEMDIPENDRAAFIDDSEALLRACAKDTSTCDYDDMIWLPVWHKVRVPAFDYVFIDEAQDLNLAQIELALASVRRDGRVFAFGDDRQAIYGFRGADSNAIGRIVERLNARTLPLSMTYRCARSIVARAQAFVPDYEAGPQNPEGEVSDTTLEKMRAEAVAGDFVISRKNAPLISLCLGFIAAGKAATIAGRDVGAGIKALVGKSRATTVEGLMSFLEAWKEAEVRRLDARGRDPQPAIDKVDCVAAISEGATSISEINARIDALFSDTDDTRRIVCTTVHKAKGLERDRVWMLTDTFTVRSQEEMNLQYVAITRAKSDLRMVSGTP